MTTIVIWCYHCEYQHKLPTFMVFFRNSNLPELRQYKFTCPNTLEEIVIPADDEATELLELSGCPSSYTDVPAEALEPHYGPVFTMGDLFDFSMDLEETVDIIEKVQAKA